jgi:hypothetical protein
VLTNARLHGPAHAMFVRLCDVIWVGNRATECSWCDAPCGWSIGKASCCANRCITSLEAHTQPRVCVCGRCDETSTIAQTRGTNLATFVWETRKPTAVGRCGTGLVRTGGPTATVMPKIKAKNKAKSKAKGKEKAGATAGARLGLGNELLRLGALRGLSRTSALPLSLPPEPPPPPHLPLAWSAILPASLPCQCYANTLPNCCCARETLPQATSKAIRQ